MDILPLIAIAFVVLSIYSWQRSRPKPRAGKRRSNGLSGQDSSPGFGDGASTREVGEMVAVEAATEPQSTRSRYRTGVLCIIEATS